MKLAKTFLLFSLIIPLCSCAGFRGPSNGASANYNPEAAVLLSRFSDYAYIKDERELNTALALEQPSYLLLRKISESETGYDAQAFVAYNDTTIIISVRGSELPFISMDWRNNSKYFQYTNASVSQYCPEAGIHGGFFLSAFRIKNIRNYSDSAYVFEEIRRLQLEGNRQIYFTGHSLGGAIANLLAMFTAYETDLAVEGVYTYGEPKGGNVAYQKCHDARLVDKTFRFINNRDVVARVRGPGSYIHVGNLAYFDSKGSLTDINTYSTIGVIVDILTFRFVRDHFLDSYKELLERNRTVNPYMQSSSTDSAL